MGDPSAIGSVSLTADTPGKISGNGLTAALQTTVDGTKPNFLLLRTDTGPERVNITAAEVIIEFDLDPDK